MNCLIIDDEPLASELIKSYIERVDGLFVAKVCSNAVEAMTYLQSNSPDLIFLDIQMPKITGIDLMKSFTAKTKVIFTTAYRDYAIQAFDLDVIDYLLKPITFERFFKAISKVYNFRAPDISQEFNHRLLRDFDASYIFLRSEREMTKVWLKDILYIESLRDYVRVKTNNTEIISYNKISYLEKILPENKFIRVHRSFIVPLDHIIAFSANNMNVNGHTIPIGRNYKNEAIKAITRANILKS
jgi:DNA-binding LytR/AlgR family response regulator